MKKIFYAADEGFLHGAHRKKHAPVELTDREAKYLLTSGQILSELPVKDEAPKKEPDPVTIDRKTR